jgi:hypothetical protein
VLNEAKRLYSFFFKDDGIPVLPAGKTTVIFLKCGLSYHNLNEKTQQSYKSATIP